MSYNSVTAPQCGHCYAVLQYDSQFNTYRCQNLGCSNVGVSTYIMGHLQ